MRSYPFVHTIVLQARGISIVVAWAVILLVAWRANLDYEFTPARTGQSPLAWPAESRLNRGDGPTLVVFLHAYCPCSRATLRELEKLLIKFPTAGEAYCLV